MGVYRIVFKPSVEKDLRRLPRAMASRIMQRIAGLASAPFPPSVAKLSGAEKLYRLRVRDYRVIYELNSKSRSLVIHYIRHRRDVYRRLP
ncbi:MAG: type II toxin-antitoxin system RelE/ParE family toxin [Acidobacteria bacterium]|nr:type II toxin-antitoxin system RelE/ParE family toxin [Acidobacteriota bacterium]MCH8268968.1 type II toxin-antitoxin system RelE/ParE family toxin [Acidobacteriota bacterium]